MALTCRFSGNHEKQFVSNVFIFQTTKRDLVFKIMVIHTFILSRIANCANNTLFVVTSCRKGGRQPSKPRRNNDTLGISPCHALPNMWCTFSASRILHHMHNFVTTATIFCRVLPNRCALLPQNVSFSPSYK